MLAQCSHIQRDYQKNSTGTEWSELPSALLVKDLV